MVSLVAVTQRSLTGPVATGGTYDTHTSGVGSVSIVSTLCSDSH